MSTKRKDFYDRPYEYRIRLKYLTFGMMLAVCGLAFLIVISRLVGLVIHSNKSTDYTLIGLFAPFLLFAPLLYWLWNTKSKPKGRQDLEEIGLKHDWDKVTKI